MIRIVKCPNCGLMLKTKGKNYFRCYHCQIAFDIEKCLMQEVEEARWRPEENPKFCIQSQDNKTPI